MWRYFSLQSKKGQNFSESNYCTYTAKESGFGLSSHTRLSVHTSPFELHEQFFPLLLQHFCRKHAKAYIATWSGSLFRKARTFTDCLRPGNLVLMAHKQNLTAVLWVDKCFSPSSYCHSNFHPPGLLHKIRREPKAASLLQTREGPSGARRPGPVVNLSSSSLLPQGRTRVLGGNPRSDTRSRPACLPARRSRSYRSTLPTACKTILQLNPGLGLWARTGRSPGRLP